MFKDSRILSVASLIVLWLITHFFSPILPFILEIWAGVTLPVYDCCSPLDVSQKLTNSLSKTSGADIGSAATTASGGSAANVADVTGPKGGSRASAFSLAQGSPLREGLEQFGLGFFIGATLKFIYFYAWRR